MLRSIQQNPGKTAVLYILSWTGKAEILKGQLDLIIYVFILAFFEKLLFFFKSKA